jgi:putative hydrolase
MSNRPIGFGPGGPDGEDDGRDQGPGDGPGESAQAFSEAFAQLLGSGPAGDELAKALSAATGGAPIDPAMLQTMMSQLQTMMATAGDGPVNWELATNVARQTVSAAGDSSVSASDRRAVEETLRLADLWLDAVTSFASAGARALTWSRAEWVEGTLPVWQRLVEPVAESVANAMGQVMNQQAGGLLGDLGDAGDAGDAEQLGGMQQHMAEMATPMIRQMGGSVFGLQVGQAIGALAGEVVSGTEVSLPLVEDGAVALLPDNIAAFSEGLDVPADEVRLYLGLRESARARLFAHVAWLGPQLLGAVEAYARGIRIDLEAIESAIRDVDGTDPASIQQALSEGLFEPQNTPAQEAALVRLETLLALVEGWVEQVTHEAASGHLPHADALRETVRRRRAAGGPAEHTFASLVGLELRPRRLREAAALWGALAQARGAEGRDAVWAHPDLLPTVEDLDDPAGYAGRQGDAAQDSAAVDAAIEELLSGAPSPQPDESDERRPEEPGDPTAPA